MYFYNKQPTFFIYDYETFGMHPALDRPAQFAGIRLDHTLHPIEKPKIFSCHIPDDYLPDPQSVLLTGITPQDTLYNSLTEPEFSYRIFNIFNVPNTCVVGYNNIRFDDEFSRNIFYRNFYDPYTWAYQNGNSRWDLLPILRAYYSLCPQGIRWPINTKNQVSFRLIDLTYANSIKHLNAHNAMSDVYATLEIMKLIKNAQPQLFQFLYNHRTKNQLKKIINLDTINPLIHITHIMHNKRKNFINFLAPIFLDPANHNTLITYDLNSNLDDLLNLNVNTIYRNLYHDQHNIFNILQKIPLQIIRLNTCPILIPMNFFKKNNDIYDHTKKALSDYQYCLKNLNFLRTQIRNIHLLKKIKSLYTIITSYLHQRKIPNQTHVDNQLYKGFFNTNDQKTIEKIRSTNIEKLSTILIDSVDIRLKSLLFFYRARNFPDTLNEKERKTWFAYKKNILLNEDKYKNYLDKINILLSYQNNLQKIKLLYLLKKYYMYFCRTILKS